MEELIKTESLNSLQKAVEEKIKGSTYWLTVELEEVVKRESKDKFTYFLTISQYKTTQDKENLEMVTTGSAVYFANKDNEEKVKIGEYLKESEGSHVIVQVETSIYKGSVSLTIKDIGEPFKKSWLEGKHETVNQGLLTVYRKWVDAKLGSEEFTHDHAMSTLDVDEQIKKIAVLCPKGSAAQGDFEKELKAEYDKGYVKFENYYASFTSQDSILTALNKIKDKISEYQLVTIIRGGGSPAEMSIFNNYGIVELVSRMACPVVVGIGHEKDSPLIYEYCRYKEHTPTAAARRIKSLIFENNVKPKFSQKSPAQNQKQGSVSAPSDCEKRLSNALLGYHQLNKEKEKLEAENDKLRSSTRTKTILVWILGFACAGLILGSM